MTKHPQKQAGMYVVVTASFAAIRNFGVRSIDSSIITEERILSR
jgi:hypothetical protein